MTEEKVGESAPGEQIDYKAELEKMKSEHETLKKSNEELRTEFLSEDYLQWLNSKDNPPAKKEEVKKAEVVDDLDKLTPKQAYEKALKDSEEKINSKLNEFQTRQKQESESRTMAEIKEFAETHEDFATYKPIMYGLSLDPKYSNANLQKLYDAAKSHVKSLAGASESEKEKSRRSAGEKPGHGSSSFQKAGKKLTADEAAEESWNEVVGDKGLSL